MTGQPVGAQSAAPAAAAPAAPGTPGAVSANVPRPPRPASHFRPETRGRPGESGDRLSRTARTRS